MAAKINDQQANAIGQILQHEGACNAQLGDPDERRNVDLYTRKGPNLPIVHYSIGDDGLYSSDVRPTEPCDECGMRGLHSGDCSKSGRLV